MTVYTCTRGAQTQRLAVVDIDSADGVRAAVAMLPERVAAVYSDPPWNPGNATYWRSHAKLGPCPEYDRFLDRLVSIYSACELRGASHLLVEQSANERHWQMLTAAVERCGGFLLDYQELYRIVYSRPSRPNALLHWGSTSLATDPTDMTGEPMVIRVFAGMRLEPGSWVVDPCMWKGTTSRVAHHFQLNCFGTELNPARLAKTVAWLAKHGYEVEES